MRELNFSGRKNGQEMTDSRRVDMSLIVQTTPDVWYLIVSPAGCSPTRSSPSVGLQDWRTTASCVGPFDTAQAAQNWLFLVYPDPICLMISPLKEGEIGLDLSKDLILRYLTKNATAPI